MRPNLHLPVIFTLAAIVAMSGCTGLDPENLALNHPLIKQFLAEHPNAQIKVTHFTAEQAKNIIDQIRSDCDNPYIDEKEFYRINVTDPDTNFFAVVWVDWQNKTVECAFKLGTEGKVVEKPKPGECGNHATIKCYEGHLYWFDSCGNKQEKKEYCQYGCTEEQCRGECRSRAEYRCYGDHVYWFDSCGNKQEKKEYCNYGCREGFCKPRPAERTCEEAGGYCIWPTAASSSGGGGQATGMMVAAETAADATAVETTTSTSVIVNYQCKEGYAASSYFCKEGGVCCIPEAGEPPTNGFCGWSTGGPCASDSDCKTGGCSGQICQSVKEGDIPTTCEYRDCYNPEKFAMQCKCLIGSVVPSTTASIIGEASVQGRCKWTKTPVPCTEEAKICPDGTYVGRNPARNCDFDPCPTKCGNGICEDGEADQCPACGVNSDPNCLLPCTAGTCPKDCPTTCKDTDGGKNYYQRGTAYTNSQELSDHCNDAYSLTEKYCYGSEIKAEAYQCPYGCKEGACVKQACIAEGQSLGAVVADNYNVCCAGLTQIGTSVAGQSGACEELVGARGYCTKCGDGVCKSPENQCNCPQDCQTTNCTDTDGGKYDYHTKGIVTTQQGSFADFCVSPTLLVENYCDYSYNPPYQGRADHYNCTNGCSEGACIQQQSCPSSIDINFSKSSYFTGENAPLTITVFDSNGNPIPSYSFLYKYDTISASATLTTGLDGRYVFNGPIYSAAGTYTYSVFTTTPGCSVKSDTATITIVQPQACAVNTLCAIKEGHVVAINTSSGVHLIKVVGVTSESAAVLSVDQTTQEVLELSNYSISGLNAYIGAVYFFSPGSQDNSVSLTINQS